MMNSDLLARFAYREGDHVAVNNDDSVPGFTAGAVGVIWCLYNTEPPGYEVTFTDADGKGFDAMLSETELMLPMPSSPDTSATPRRSTGSELLSGKQTA